jgi:GrpB-like predicted nucleotidyltransferase (UPF0157 family)
VSAGAPGGGPDALARSPLEGAEPVVVRGRFPAVARISIEPYSEAWPAEFQRLGRRIRSILGDRALRIDHIGSTSVPGLAAKDRLDVQVTVAELTDANALGGAGFEELRGCGDHRPPGAEGPEEDWSKRFFNSPEPERRANVHVRVEGRPNQRYALLFRDYLRAHPAAAEAYAELKRRLAAELRDVAAYADVKDPVCDLIIVAAQEWATATDWQLGPSDA